MDQNPNMSWYRLIELAFRNPQSCEMDNLLSLVRGTGMHKLQSLELRQAAGEILQKYGQELSPSARWFVTRLQNAGYPQTYPDYLGLGALTPCTSSTCDLTLQAKNTFRLMSELSLHLLDLPELVDHPSRAELEKRVKSFSERNLEYLFSMSPAHPPSSDLVRFSLAPESDVVDELIFIRVLQCSELIFGTARDLVIKSLEWMSYGEILEVVRNLHWVSCLSELVVPLLGVLSPMSRESWHQIRPLIMAPSAIQSPNFHHLNPNIDELARILKHPRFIPSQHRYLSMAEDLLSEAQANFQTWERGHRAIASKYNQISKEEPKSEGLRWLEGRRPPFSYEDDFVEEDRSES